MLTDRCNVFSKLNRSLLMTKQNYHQELGFLTASCAGVTVDLVIFQLLICLGIEPHYSNMLSSGLAITMTYLFLSRYIYKKKSSTLASIIFFGYYLLSITSFSYVIGFSSKFLHCSPMYCKIPSLPLSLMVNYFFSNIIIGKK